MPGYPDHVYVVFADYGPQGGSWGPAAIEIPGRQDPMPLVYTGTNEGTIATLKKWAVLLSKSGLETVVCRFEGGEVIEHHERGSEPRLS